jgi:hypothetical protein
VDYSRTIPGLYWDFIGIPRREKCLFGAQNRLNYAKSRNRLHYTSQIEAIFEVDQELYIPGFGIFLHFFAFFLRFP